MRKYFSTTYPVVSKASPDGRQYVGYVLAKDYKDALTITANRNLNEKIDSLEGVSHILKLPVTRPSTIFMRMCRNSRVTERHRDIKKLLHLCCFLLHLNERKGLPMPDLYSDLGLIHQLTHGLMIAKSELGEDFDGLVDVLRELESNHPEMFLTASEISTLTS